MRYGRLNLIESYSVILLVHIPCFADSLQGTLRANLTHTLREKLAAAKCKATNSHYPDRSWQSYSLQLSSMCNYSLSMAYCTNITTVDKWPSILTAIEL